MKTIQVDHIEWPGENPHMDDPLTGHVYYLLLSPCPDDPCDHVCLSHPKMTHQYEAQPFRLGGTGRREGLRFGGIYWGWDGNKERPTLTPSLGAFPVYEGKPTGRDYNAHLFLTNGAIQLCGDATVVVHANPVPCKVEDWNANEGRSEYGN